MLDSAVLESISAFLFATQSIDKTIREDGEKRYAEMLKSDPSTLLCGLAQIVSTSSDERVRMLAAVFVRKSVFSATFWKAIPDEAKNYCKQSLLAALTAEPNESIRRKISDAVAELASIILVGDTWPELLKLLEDGISSENAAYREICFRLTYYAPRLLFNVPVDAIKGSFMQGMSDSEVAVRAEAFKSFLNYYLQCPSNVRKRLSDIVPRIGEVTVVAPPRPF